jgi:type IV secretion system protein VirD4
MRDNPSWGSRFGQFAAQAWRAIQAAAKWFEESWREEFADTDWGDVALKGMKAVFFFVTAFAAIGIIGLATGRAAVSQFPGLAGGFPLYVLGVYGLAIWGGVVWTMNAMEWGGHKMRPRWWAWRAATWSLWLGVFLIIVGFNWQNYDLLWRTHDLPVPNFLATWLSFWALLAMAIIFVIGMRPDNWRNYRSFTWLVLCGVTVAGYPSTLVLYIFGFAFLPPIGGAQVLYLVAPALLLPLLGTLTVMAIGGVIWLAAWVFIFLLGLPLWVFDYLDKKNKEAQIRRQKKQGLADYIMRFHLWLRHDPVPDVPDDSKGSRFATNDETTALQNPNGAPYGYVQGRPYFLNTEKHILIQASTRSGKGVAVIIPRLLLYPGSMFVLDPKGENARATGRRRAELNGKVHYLDPFGISGKPKSRFNPLSRFTPHNMEAESKALAAALVLADTRDHWIAAGQQLLASIIMHVYTSPNIPPEKKDLVTVRRYLLERVKPTLKAMVDSEVAGGMLAALAQSFLNTPEKELGSIISTAQRETEILDNPDVAKSLLAAGEGDEVDFADWHTGTMTVFLCLAAPKFPVFSRWLRLVLTSALDEMTEKLRPPPLPVVFMLDELATLGHLSTVENAIGLSAGYGVQIVTVFQDVAQMRDLYKGRWTSFVGNAGVRVLFNLDDFETAEYWSKFIGGRLVETLSTSEDIYGIAEKQSRGEAVRPLLTPDEIMLKFAGGDRRSPESPGGIATMGKMLLLPQGSRPIIADRVPYWEDPTLKGYWDDPRVPIA